MCVGLICPGSVWNSGVYEGGADHRIIVDDGGTQMGIRSEVQWMSGWEPNVGSKTRNANMIQKVEGPRRNCHGSSYNYGRQTIKAGELSEHVTTWRGNVIVGTIPANGASELNQIQIRHQKCGRQKTLGWTSLRRPVPNGWQRGPYSLKCRSTTHYGGYIVGGSFARKKGNAQDTCWKCKGKIEKAQKKKSRKEDCLP